MRILLLSCMLILGACGGRAAAPVAPVESSEAAVRSFMRAVADSNLSRMGELWGTDRGPASVTRPAGYEKRVVLMQIYLRGDSIRILSDRPDPAKNNQRVVAMELYRGRCVKQIPVTTVRTSTGSWLVFSVDISLAGNPVQPCEGGR